MIGLTVASRYRILEKIGSGGMGVVYRAQDLQLARHVTLKFLPEELARDRHALARFHLEARAASALDHPNICTIHDVAEDTGRAFIVMQFLEGKTLKQELADGRLEIQRAVGLVMEVAAGLAAAHSKGIVHRDIKPANILVTASGQAKILDFGIAKIVFPDQSQAEVSETVSLTRTGVLIGTAEYMSPEQALGRKTGPQSDVFSLGVLLYEMLTGRKPFLATSPVETFDRIVNTTPESVSRINASIPAALECIVFKCLEKEPAERYPTGNELLLDLRKFERKATSRRKRTLGVAAVAFTALMVIVAAGWWWIRSARINEARSLVAEAGRLADEEFYVAAFDKLLEAEPYLPDDKRLRDLRAYSSRAVTIGSNPQGANVYVADYNVGQAPQWLFMGKTPLENIRVPIGYLRWKVEKDGFETIEKTLWWLGGETIQNRLFPKGTAPGMVYVLPGPLELFSLPRIQVPEFWIDKFEVTNKDFKTFVDQGGYLKPDLWQQPFVQGGRTLSWREAVSRFQDRAGRPGPATWELGKYPDGQGDYPASGVSWFEAAAYCESVGKSLPTINHWYRAASLAGFNYIVRLSNFSGKGPAPVGSFPGLGPHGTYDMGGNVKEWVFNKTNDRRYILGGAWNAPSYEYRSPDAQDPFDRLDLYGFRCAKYIEPPTDTFSRSLDQTPESDGISRDFNKEQPNDEYFRQFRTFWAYDHSNLDATLDGVDDSPDDWRIEIVSFNASYENERLPAYLFLPRNFSPPFQTVIWFPGGAAGGMTIQDLKNDLQWTDFILRTGRAVLYPIYKGTYDRRFGRGDDGLRFQASQSGWRDSLIFWAKDLSRSVDYLETRPEIDSKKLAYMGLSRGAAIGPIMTAIESRFSASILLGGGFFLRRRLPVSEAIHFAPHVKNPTLMVNGYDDFFFPYETSQKPMYSLLGVPQSDKKHMVLDAGHIPPRQAVIKEVLDWLDRYLGPVETSKRR